MVIPSSRTCPTDTGPVLQIPTLSLQPSMAVINHPKSGSSVLHSQATNSETMHLAENKGPSTKRRSFSDGRIDKRKRRRPTRSLPPPSTVDSQQNDQQPFLTLKMSFVDDYQRNPTAYSRALMDTERPYAKTHHAITRLNIGSLAGHTGPTTSRGSFSNQIHSNLPLSAKSLGTNSTNITNGRLPGSPLTSSVSPPPSSSLPPPSRSS
ncbi:hypothetical protein GGI05_003918, partial [Coemansia sp. RSA 2603]